LSVNTDFAYPLKGMNYHMAIDMWSLGCILAELYTGYPIFPGENEQEQLACIMEVLGLPERYLIERSSRRKLFFGTFYLLAPLNNIKVFLYIDSTGAPRPFVNSKGRRRRPGAKSLAQVLKCDDELFVDFIAKCLAWDPDRRLKPDPAMRRKG
jgi:dual specificity tyrosine-phosphorylation-regulated kinase 2/3/4